jgi:hypothetical protein
MKYLHRHLMLATALATGLAVAAPLVTGTVRAADSTTMPTDPGFNPGTGQINPGVEQQAPSSSSDFRKIPTPAEARAAKMMPVSTQPSLGNWPAVTPQASDANAGAQTASGQQSAATTGAATSEKAGAEPAASIASGSTATAAAGVPPSGPIGSVGETSPAKFSERNDILDRVPIMALPSSLSDQERQKIYQAVMADNKMPVASGADTLAPASELSTQQALNEMHSLPASVSGIAGMNKLKYVKAKNKILLVEPSTRIVIEQITS